MSEINYSRNKPTMTGNLVGLENYFFSFGEGMQKNWVDSNRAFLNHTGNKFGQSVKSYLMTGEIVVTDIDESLLPKFKTEVEKDDHLKRLE